MKYILIVILFLSTACVYGQRVEEIVDGKFVWREPAEKSETYTPQQAVQEARRCTQEISELMVEIQRLRDERTEWRRIAQALRDGGVEVEDE